METVSNIDLMCAATGEASAVLRILANPDRLLLLREMSQGKKSVGELEELPPIQQPTLSQQLGVLRSEGLLNQRRDGKRMFYSIAGISGIVGGLLQLH